MYTVRASLFSSISSSSPDCFIAEMSLLSSSIVLFFLFTLQLRPWFSNYSWSRRAMVSSSIRLLSSANLSHRFMSLFIAIISSISYIVIGKESSGHLLLLFLLLFFDLFVLSPVMVMVIVDIREERCANVHVAVSK